VLKAADGAPLPDIRSSADNAAVADQILAFVREQAARPDVVLHGSIAGGRKTMSMWLGNAFMLYGRSGDRLTHVLVSPEFEGAPDFFYPPPRPCPIRLADGRKGDASGARVELADIPFLRLRHLLPTDARGQPAHHGELVRATQLVLDESAHSLLTVDLGKGLVAVGSRPVQIEAGPLALYALFAAQKAERCVRQDLPACGACRDCFFGLGKDFGDEQRDRLVALYRALGGRQPVRFDATLKGGGVPERLRSLRSKANAAARRALGLMAGPYLIEAVGAYNQKRYGLLLDKNRIRLVGATNRPPAPRSGHPA
jgi:hypothetical protein